jgi:hypothetical protein
LPAKLTVCYPNRPAVESVLFEQRDYRVGRAQPCELIIQHPTVSRQHAVVGYSHEQWRLNDVQSQNGTKVDGELVTDRQLKGNELISLGAVDCLFELQSQKQIDFTRSHNQWRLQQSRQTQAAMTQDSLLQCLDERLLSLMSLTGTERGLIMLGSNLLQLTVCAVKGMSRNDFSATGFEGSVGAIKLAIEQQQLIMAMDVNSHAALRNRESIRRKDIAALACVPLLAGEQLLGLVYLDSHLKNKHLSELDIEIMKLVCSQIEMNIRGLLIHHEINELIALVSQPCKQQDIIKHSVISLVS